MVLRGLEGVVLSLAVIDFYTKVGSANIHTSFLWFSQKRLVKSCRRMSTYTTFKLERLQVQHLFTFYILGRI